MKQKGKVLTVFRLEGGSGQEAQREEIGNSRRGGVGLPSYLPGGGNDNQSILTSHWQLKVMLMQLIYAHQHSITYIIPLSQIRQDGSFQSFR